MSLLNKASLIQIPSGYKDGTLYSAKPTNGDGDFTFSRGSNLAATRVNSEGLIQKGRENLLTYSNDLTQWSPSGIGSTTATTDPLGGNKAFILDDQDGAAYYRHESNGISITGVVTSSVYIKKTTGSLTNYAGLEMNDESVFVIFDTTNGTYNLTATNPYLFINVETAYNDWWRVSLAVSSFTSGQKGLRLWSAISSDGSTLNASAIGSNIFYAPQTEQGLVATDYIETTTTTEQAGILEDMPRLDYSGGASCPSLLLEPQRSNLLTQSEYFDTTPYSKVNATVTTNDITSPESVLNATKLISTGGASRVETFPTLSDNTNYTASIFAKQGDVDYIMINLREKSGNQHNVFFDLSDGTIGTTNGSPISKSIKLVGDYYKVSMTIDSSSGSGTPRLQYLIANTDNNVVTTSGQYIHIYGAQLEQGSYPTSYIPTYGAISTRSEDIVDGAVDANLFNDDEGVLFIEFAALADTRDNDFRFLISNGTNNERIQIFLPTSNILNVDCIVSNSATANLTYTLPNPSSTHKVAFKYKNNDFALWVDGVERGTDTSGATPSGLDRLDFYRTPNNNNYVEANVKQTIYFNSALTNDELADLTTI